MADHTSSDRLLHIGFPKTGTTVLQNGYFAKHRQIHFINKRRDFNQFIFCDLRQKETFCYRPDIGQNLVCDFANEVKADSQKKVFVYSNESLSFSADGTAVDRAIMAERLSELFGSTKVLITIRNQFDFIRSLYDEYVKQMGCYFNFKTFLEANYWRFYTYLFSQIYYHDIYQFYCDTFGRDQVKVVLYEDLKKDFQAVCDTISDFMGIDCTTFENIRLNPSLSHWAFELTRLLNRLRKNNFGKSYFMPVCDGVVSPGLTDVHDFKPTQLERDERWRMQMYRVRKLDKIFKGQKKIHHYPQDWQQRIWDLYAENNTRLAKATGLDLQTYGYPVLKEESIDSVNSSQLMTKQSFS